MADDLHVPIVTLITARAEARHFGDRTVIVRDTPYQAQCSCLQWVGHADHYAAAVDLHVQHRADVLGVDVHVVQVDADAALLEMVERRAEQVRDERAAEELRRVAKRTAREAATREAQDARRKTAGGEWADADAADVLDLPAGRWVIGRGGVRRFVRDNAA